MEIENINDLRINVGVFNRKVSISLRSLLSIALPCIHAIIAPIQYEIGSVFALNLIFFLRCRRLQVIKVISYFCLATGLLPDIP